MFKKIFLTLGALVLLFALSACSSSTPVDVYTGDIKLSEEDHINGDPDAEISLIEYSDFECPYCKGFHTTAEALVRNYDGKVNWAYRHFPLSFHDPLATKEAIATECAADLGDNDTFWDMAELIYERTSSNGKGLEVEQLPEMAEEIGLDKDTFKECMDSGKFDAKVKASVAQGEAYDVSGTPATFIVNNKTGESVFISGNQPFDGFTAVIDKMLSANSK